MCGLVGVFGNITFKTENMFEDLLQMDVIRGPHSTGVAVLKNEKAAPRIIKDTISPTDLLCGKEYTSRVGFPVLMMGHNRWATKGEVNKANAHPFQSKHIVLTHNGTLHGTYTLPTDKKFDTDSETITHCIAKKGVDETWKNLDGAAVLVWWNKKEKSLNIISNEKRPFHFATTPDESCLMWASEGWMLRGAAERRGVTLEKNTLYYPPKNTLFTYKLVKGKVVGSSRTLEEFTWVGRALNTYFPNDFDNPVYRRVYNHGAGKWQSNDDFLGAQDKLRKELKGTEGMATGKISFITFRDKKMSCHFCEDKQINYMDYETALLVSDDKVVCGNCVITAKENNINIAQEILL